MRHCLPSCQTKFFPSFCCHYSSCFSLISTHTTHSSRSNAFRNCSVSNTLFRLVKRRTFEMIMLLFNQISPITTDKIHQIQAFGFGACVCALHTHTLKICEPIKTINQYTKCLMIVFRSFFFCFFFSSRLFGVVKMRVHYVKRNNCFKSFECNVCVCSLLLLQPCQIPHFFFSLSFCYEYKPL